MENSSIQFKPILFSTPMIQAILRGEKTQTRRIIKGALPIGNLEETLKRSRYKIGNILWVRETWRGIEQETGGYRFEYKATEKINIIDKWKPSIFMPKEACRIFLKITGIRIERLEDITKEDAVAEGVEKWQQCGCTRYKSYIKPMIGFWDTFNTTGGVHPAIASYRSLWAKIYGFDNLMSNPLVFVYEFERTDISFACQ